MRPNKVERKERMINFDFLSGEKKKWTDFISSIEEGEEVIFSVYSPCVIDTIRSVASKLNTSTNRDYKYVVEGDNIKLRVRISTKRPL